MSCQALDCQRDALTRGYCATHYRHRLHTGRYGYRDAHAAREHVAALRGLGWTWQGIADAAGLSSWVAHRLHSGQTRRLLAESETAILSVPLARRDSHRGVPAVGARRRVQALAWMGWPLRVVAERAGYPEATVRRELCRGRISVRLAHAIADVYDEMSGVRGPSRVAAGKARQHGFAPPAAWDEDSIDDPCVQAAGVRRGVA